MVGYLTIADERTDHPSEAVTRCDRCGGPLGFSTRISLAQVGRYVTWIICLGCARGVEKALERTRTSYLEPVSP
jgi:hypothetical protein